MFGKARRDPVFFRDGVRKRLNLPALWGGLAAALLLLAPISLFGRELDFRGQKVTVEGLAEGDWEYVGGEPNSGTEELILVFKDTASAGTLSVPYGFEARMLLVGGGGAGGYGTTGGTNPGGGGGEVFELEKKGAEIRALFAF